MIAINTVTQAVSRLSPPWTKLLVADDELYGLSTTGLEKLSGPLEAGAAGLLRTGKMNLQPGAVCAIHPFHALFSADAPLVLNVVGDEDGLEREIAYSVSLQTSEEKRQRRISLGRGSKASTWSLEITEPEDAEHAVNWSISSAAVDIPAIKLPRN